MNSWFLFQMKSVVDRFLIHFESVCSACGILTIPCFTISPQAGMHIYSRASAKGKRVQVSAILLTLLSTVFANVANMFNIIVSIEAKYIADQLKCPQSNMGAKNHGVVMPDANIDSTVNALVGAGFGAAGQRCMALSTVVFVGDSKPW